MVYKCPLDGFFLIFDYDEESFSYTCPSCNTIYLIPQGQRYTNDILKDIESQALLKLEEYKKRLEEIKKEEKSITKIFEFTEKRGLLSKLNKANLSANKI